MNRVVICVHGIDFRNRGALMMLDAIARFVRRACPAGDVCVPFSDGTRNERRRAAVGTALLSRRLRLGWLPLPGLAAAPRRSPGSRHLAARHAALLSPTSTCISMQRLRLQRSRARQDPAMAGWPLSLTAAGTPLVVLHHRPSGRLRTLPYAPRRGVISNRPASSSRAMPSHAHLDRLGLTCELAEAPDFTEFDVVPRTAAVAERRVAVVPNTRFLDVAGSGADYVERLVEIVARPHRPDYAPNCSCSRRAMPRSPRRSPNGRAAALSDRWYRRPGHGRCPGRLCLRRQLALPRRGRGPAPRRTGAGVRLDPQVRGFARRIRPCRV